VGFLKPNYLICPVLLTDLINNCYLEGCLRTKNELIMTTELTNPSKYVAGDVAPLNYIASEVSYVCLLFIIHVCIYSLAPILCLV